MARELAERMLASWVIAWRCLRVPGATVARTSGAHPAPEGSHLRLATGLTLIEMLLVLTIMGILSALVMPNVREAVDRAKIARAIGDIRTLQAELSGYEFPPSTLAEIDRSDLLDPWGNPYQYLVLAGGKGGARKDKFLVPLNSDYDLYSMGKDGKSQAPLTAKASKDDVIRANDGGFIGLASRY